MDILKTFDRDDCLHYKHIKTKGCCNRDIIAGVCTVPDQNGNIVHRTCSMKQSYCKYQPKEVEDVYPTKLDNPNRGNRHGV